MSNLYTDPIANRASGGADFLTFGYQANSSKNAGAIITTSTSPVRARADAGGTSVAVMTASNLGAANARVSMLLYFPADYDTGDQLGLIGRGNTGATGYWPIYHDGNWHLYKLPGFSDVASAYADAITAGSYRLLSLDMSGSTITAYVDGVSRISGTDATYGSDGLGGIYLQRNNTANDSVSPQVVWFGAVTIGGSAGIAAPSCTPGSTTCAVTWTPDYNTSVPCQFRLQRSTSSGTGFANVGTLSFQLSYSDSGLSAGTTYYYRVLAIDPVDGTTVRATSAETSVTTTGGGGGGSTLAPSVATYSPGNWDTIGSTDKIATNIGAYFTLAVTGTTILKVAVDASALVDGGAIAAGYPQLSYSLNGAAIQTVILASGSTYPINLTGLSGTNQIRVWVKSTNHNYDAWGATPVSAVRLTGFEVDPGGSATTPTGLYAAKASNLIVHGDSIACGYYSSGSGDDRNTDGHLAWPQKLASALGTELGVIAFPGMGVLADANGNVPAFATSYNLYRTGRSRSAPTAAYVVLALGENDTTGSTFATAYQTAIGTLRTYYGANAEILCLIPFSQNRKANIDTAFAAYQAANPSDTKVHKIDCGTGLATLLGTTLGTVDGVHPTTYGQAECSALAAEKIGYALGGSGSGSTVQLLIL